MNKKSSIFYITTVVVAIVCLILDLVVPNDKFSYLGICFSITMLVYGLSLIIRGFCFKIDSSLFLGISIFSFGIISILTYFTPYGYADLWQYILLGIGVACFITGFYFKLPAQKKLTVLFLGLFVIALCFQFDLYRWWVMLIIMLAWIIVFILINNILFSRRK